MTNIIYASTASDNDLTARTLTDNNFNVNIIRDPSECDKDGLKQCKLLLIDHSFTPFKGIDFLMQAVSQFHMPALYLSSQEEPKTAIEALNSGAHNYIIKTDNYTEFLAFAVSDTIRRFNDNCNLRETIVSLKNKVKELEKRLGNTNSSYVSEPTADNDILGKLIESLKSGNVNLPAYPEISSHFKELANRGASVSEITHCLQKDAAISSKLISLSNSSYYRGMAPIKTLEQSVSRIGTHDVRNYVELIANRGLYTAANKKYSTYLEGLWKHSLACAYSCQELCRVLVKGNPTELFTMGLFHDIGKLFLVQAISELESRNEFPSTVENNEWQAIVKTNHAQFGASLMKRWKLSKEYGEVIVGQEQIDSVNNPAQEALIVHLANDISHELGYSDSPEQTGKPVDLGVCKAVEKLALEDAQISEVKKKVTELMEAGLTI